MEEPTTVGLSAQGHDGLKRLKEFGYFNEMTDAYRFAIALGIAHEMKSPGAGPRSTILNVGTLDPDKALYNAIKSLSLSREEPVYTLAEQYAEWGVAEMTREADKGTLSLASLLEEAAEKADSPKP
jgi:hypothetical protein